MITVSIYLIYSYKPIWAFFAGDIFFVKYDNLHIQCIGISVLVYTCVEVIDRMVLYL